MGNLNRLVTIDYALVIRQVGMTPHGLVSILMDDRVRQDTYTTCTSIVETEYHAHAAKYRGINPQHQKAADTKGNRYSKNYYRLLEPTLPTCGVAM